MKKQLVKDLIKYLFNKDVSRDWLVAKYLTIEWIKPNRGLLTGLIIM